MQRTAQPVLGGSLRSGLQSAPGRLAVAVGLCACFLAAVAWGLWSVRGAGVEASAAAVPGARVEQAEDTPLLALASALEEERASVPERRIARAAGPDGSSTPRFVFGRVTDLDTGEGLPGITVRTSGMGRHNAETVTGADGEFELPTFTRFQRVAVVVPVGWESMSDAHSCEADYWSGCEPPDFELRRREMSPVRLHVSDARTGEAFPDCVVELIGSDTETLSTDHAGELVGTLDFECRTMTALVRSDPDAVPQRATFEHTSSEKPASVQVPMGPTYSVSFLLPAGTQPTDFRAYLKRAGEFRARPLLGESGQVRDGSPWWVRLPRMPRGAGSFVLCLFSDNGQWFGEAPVEVTPGRVPGLQTFSLSQGGALTIEVASPKGLPVALAGFSFSDPGRGVSGAPLPKAQGGRYEWPVLPAGGYDVTVRHRNFRTITQRVRVVPGEHAELRLALAPAEATFALSGRVHFESGVVDTSLSVVLTPLEGDMPPKSARIRPGPEAEGFGTFRFAKLPSQPFTARVTNSHFASVPASLVVVPPGESLEFVVLDEVRTLSLSLRIAEAETGARIERLNISYSIDGGPRRTLSSVRATTVTLGRFPARASIQWKVEALGHAPAMGDETAFEPVEGGGSGERGQAGEFGVDRRIAHVVLWRD